VTTGLATVTVLYPAACPALARIALLADALAAWRPAMTEADQIRARLAADDKPTHTTYELAATIAPQATHMTAATRINNLAAAFAA
jgi:hypothetical protein